MAESRSETDLDQSDHPAVDPAAWVQEHADALYSYAKGRVGSSHEAEDLVQETFLAALGAVGRFQGKSTARTWLVAILRRKLIDHYRKGQSQGPRETMEALPPTSPPFQATGSWTCPPAPWGSPGRAIEDEEFREVLAGCVDNLPSHLADTFLLRECEELEANEVCRALRLSAANFRVRLHRARLMLRDCLERKWFGDTEAPTDRSGKNEGGPPTP